jgi:hypothetical protein
MSAEHERKKGNLIGGKHQVVIGQRQIEAEKVPDNMIPEVCNDAGIQHPGANNIGAAETRHVSLREP